MSVRPSRSDVLVALATGAIALGLLGARSRLHAVVWAYQNKVVAVPE